MLKPRDNVEMSSIWAANSFLYLMLKQSLTLTDPTKWIANMTTVLKVPDSRLSPTPWVGGYSDEKNGEDLRKSFQ